MDRCQIKEQQREKKEKEREKKEKELEEWRNRECPGHNYLVYAESAGILKFGMTTQRRPYAYIRGKYKPKQLWRRILVVPTFQSHGFEFAIKKYCTKKLKIADGLEYFFADDHELQGVKEFMQSLAEDQ